MVIPVEVRVARENSGFGCVARADAPSEALDTIVSNGPSDFMSDPSCRFSTRTASAAGGSGLCKT